MTPTLSASPKKKTPLQTTNTSKKNDKSHIQNFGQNMTEKTNKQKTTQTVRSHQPPQPFFCKFQVSRQDLGSPPFPRPPSAHAAPTRRFNRMLTPVGQPCKCSLSQAGAKMFPSIDWFGLEKNSPLTEFELFGP